jgi:hypothetical protein
MAIAHSHPIRSLGARPVILRRLSLLLLLAACSVLPGLGAPHPSRSRGGSCCIQRTAVERLFLPVPSSIRAHSISPFSPWRYRLKSVLQETDSRITQESDLGPMPLPDRFYSSMARTPRLDQSRPTIPLRC